MSQEVEEPEVEAAVQLFDRARDLPLLTLMERELADVDVALGRLDDGTYEQCEICGGRIADSTLAADPVTRRCSTHRPEPAFEPERSGFGADF